MPVGGTALKMETVIVQYNSNISHGKEEINFYELWNTKKDHKVQRQDLYICNQSQSHSISYGR